MLVTNILFLGTIDFFSIFITYYGSQWGLETVTIILQKIFFFGNYF